VKLDKKSDSPFRVWVVFDKKTQILSWPSLVHLWSDWYRQYLEADYPRLFVRFEDMLFHGPTLVGIIANCTGASVPDEFRRQTNNAKGHGSNTNFLSAIMKTGDAKRRIQQMTKQDLEFAKANLDKDLMRIFEYNIPEME